LRWARRFRLAETSIIALACALAAGCASPHKHVAAKPPGVVVPGVVGAPNPSASSAASGGSGGSRGVVRAGSNGTVLLGGWAPGGAADLATAGALAYFKWLNARGGVYGRAIDYRVLDDHGSAAFLPSLAHQLVQGDAIFAIFGAQGPQPAAVTSYLDSSAVPDLFANWTCDCLATAATRLTQIFGWPLIGSREGELLGTYVARHYPGQKVAIEYAPDTTGRDTLAGFLATARGVRIVARTTVAGPSADGAAVAAAKSARAQVFVTFTTPGPATSGLASAMAASHWHVPLIADASGLGQGLPDGTITDGFLPSTASPPNSPAGTWITLFNQIRNRYLRDTPLSPALISGMAAAYQLAATLFRAGTSLSRQGLLTALNGLPPGPAAGPLAYTATDHSGAASAYFGTVKDGTIVPAEGTLTIAGGTQGVTTYPGPWQKAPANGIPPH
jgi:branched-chain amino acid transport system substrate-binding protein